MIVGGSTGIGRAVSVLLADRWEVVCVDRHHGVDVTDRVRYLRTLRFHVADADALVYCAGQVVPGSLVDITQDDWDDTIEVNLTGAFRAIQLFARQDREGPVVLVGSTAGHRPSPGWAAYSASKAALANLAETADAELSGHGIRVYCITPGRCATALRARLAPGEDPASIMQPAEVAQVIAQLLDDHDGVLAGSPIKVARS
ncbi:MAG: SDR family oxidoreductase [Acidimicrobiia bacterium]|nr:SDR family oxidoreductase [Acidimicrobiia bacterium]